MGKQVQKSRNASDWSRGQCISLLTLELIPGGNIRPAWTQNTLTALVRREYLEETGDPMGTHVVLGHKDCSQGYFSEV